MRVSPVLIEVFKNRFSSIAEEMGMILSRTAFSPNIKDRKDFSCAVFDGNGDIIAQAAHIPVHLGSMPMSVKSVINSLNLEDDDMAMVNDPFKGGTHLPDITVIAPVFVTDNKSPLFFVANRAHHSDVGGISPGSMPLSSSIFQEGIIIPPVKIVKKGKIDESIYSFLLNNVRTPDEREGDFAAQIMANITGINRIKELVIKYSQDTAVLYASELINYSEKITRKTIRKIPDGVYAFEDEMDDDGYGTENIKIKVIITVENDEVLIDFTKSSLQVKGCINSVYAVTLSAVMYVFRSLINEDIPANAGCLKPIKIKTEKGTIVDSVFPCAVAGGNVETSQRIVDTLLGALTQALPEKIPAASQGTMNNLTIGGLDEKTRQPFAFYETIAGGMGASFKSNGESAVHSHMTNTLNTPVESLEFSYPVIVTRYSVRKFSGGQGIFNGGDGIIREMMLTSDALVTVLSERRKKGPYGLCGGKSGKKGKNVIIKNGKYHEKPGKFMSDLKKGDTILIKTPGGGGYGKKI